MTSRVELRTGAVAVLKSAVTDAGDKVFSPRAWPTPGNGYPCIICRTPHERKELRTMRGQAPGFFSTILLTAVCRVEDFTEDGAQGALDSLSEQIENAILTNGKFIYDYGIQQFASVEISQDIKAESDMYIGEAIVLFSIEVAQQFNPTIDAAGTVIAPDLDTVNVSVTNQDGDEMAHQVIDLTGG